MRKQGCEGQQKVEGYLGSGLRGSGPGGWEPVN